MNGEPIGRKQLLTLNGLTVFRRLKPGLEALKPVTPFHGRVSGLAIFDLEGTLVNGELLPELASFTGKEREVLTETIKALKGGSPWFWSLIKRLKMVRNIKEELVRDISRELPITAEMEALARKLREQGFVTVVLTGGFEHTALEVAKRVKLNYVVSNKFIFKGGVVKGVLVNVNDNKGEWLRLLAKTFKTPLKRVLAIGDGFNDLEMLRLAGLGVMLGSYTNPPKPQRVVKVPEPSKVSKVVQRWLKHLKENI